MSKDDQVVMALKRRVLFGKNDEEAFQGFRLWGEVDYQKKFTDAKDPWMKRGDIEEDPKIKHPIVYCPIVNLETGRAFIYNRNKGEETRLSSFWSLGVGGHIEQEDSGNYPIIDAIRRELREEVGLRDYSINPFGYLNDDTNKVGEVHFGLVYLIGTSRKELKANEDEIGKGSYMAHIDTISDMSKRQGFFEGWSQMLVDPLTEYFRKA